MPRNKTAHAQLDELRQAAAGERMKQRELEAQLQGARVEVEQASAAIADGYAAEDQKAVAAAGEAEDAAVAKVKDLQHRLNGAEVRVERAQRALDEFQRDHARDLLAEREEAARAITDDLSASVRETVRLSRAYIAERQAVDQLVAAVPGATPRADGPPATHPWERQLKDLERALTETPELPPPLPRWQGLGNRKAEDSTARRLQLQRRKRRSAADQRELDRINQQSESHQRGWRNGEEAQQRLKAQGGDPARPESRLPVERGEGGFPSRQQPERQAGRLPEGQRPFRQAAHDCAQPARRTSPEP
jgi:hypothetical protein